MKIAHLSDLHFSMQNLEESSRCMAFAVDRAIAENCEVAVLSGDATDHRLDLHSPAVAALLLQVRRLADHCPVLILHGTWSHEPPGTLDIFRTLGGKHQVYVADRICQVALHLDGYWHESVGHTFDKISSCQALFSVMPQVSKGAVAAVVGAAGAAEAMGDFVATILQGFAPMNLQAREFHIPTIAVSHGTVHGCISEQGVPMISLDYEFTLGALFAAEASAFLLGHIHLTQGWQHDGRRAAYAGSIGRFHYGETDDKHFLMWDVQAAGAEYQAIVTPAKKLLQIDFNDSPSMEELAEHALHAAGAYVRIRYCLDDEHRHSVDREAVRALFANAAECRIEARINPIQRARSEGMNRTPSLADKLIKWASVTNTEAEPLRERLELLQSREPEQIVSAIAGSSVAQTVH